MPGWGGVARPARLVGVDNNLLDGKNGAEMSGQQHSDGDKQTPGVWPLEIGNEPSAALLPPVEA